MPITPHWTYYSVVLQLAEQNGPLSRKSMRELAAKAAGITPEEYILENDRGTNIFNTRIHWAVQDLVGVGAFVRPSKGIVEITDFGRSLLSKFPQGFSRKELEATPEWVQWQSNWSGKNSKPTTAPIQEGSSIEQTPDERLYSVADELKKNLAMQLVQKIQALQPSALEHIVLQLLHKMGYGENEDALEHLGGAGDEGVDGVINLDRLGLQKIYVQAKRYKDGSSITPTTVQAFLGALVSKSAVGGVFITTSEFTKAAREAASKSSLHIELIDGVTLGRMLIENKVGIRVTKVIEVAEMDEDYFDDLDI
jgi:restriction system protein